MTNTNQLSDSLLSDTPASTSHYNKLPSLVDQRWQVAVTVPHLTFIIHFLFSSLDTVCTYWELTKIQKNLDTFEISVFFDNPPVHE